MSHPTIDPARHKQLFLDDHAIESMSGVKRVLHQPEKHGPVIRPDRSRGQTAVQTRSVPQWNSEKRLWEWWYWASYEVPPHGPRNTTSIDLVHYAVSADGVAWEAPSLGLYEWQGSNDNNVACDPEDGDRAIYHVIRDEHDPDPRRRYKGLFGKKDRRPGVSPDGLHWTMLDVPPVPSHDESHATYDESSGQYLAMVKHPTEWGRSVWLSTSKDFATWTDPRLILHTDETDRENRKRRLQGVIDDPKYLTPPLVDKIDYKAEIYHMAVMPYEGIYVGFPRLFNPAGAIPPPHGNFTAIQNVELTVSRDLHSWERVADRAMFIAVDPWDGVTYGTTGHSVCGRPIVHDQREIWVYYNAQRFRGPDYLYKDVEPRYFKDKSAMCLAKLRLDGFVSLDADEEGSVVTTLFVSAGEELYVNALADGGELRAEVLDAETMEPLPGLSASQCNPLSGDHLDGRLTWGEAALPRRERPMRVRFLLRDASLYAFWLGS